VQKQISFEDNFIGKRQEAISKGTEHVSTPREREQDQRRRGWTRGKPNVKGFDEVISKGPKTKEPRSSVTESVV